MISALSDLGRQQVLDYIAWDNHERKKDGLPPFRPCPAIQLTLEHRLGHSREDLIQKVREMGVKEAQAWLDTIRFAPEPTMRDIIWHEACKRVDGEELFRKVLEDLVESIPVEGVKDEIAGA